jgi:hypothetical protein
MSCILAFLHILHKLGMTPSQVAVTLQPTPLTPSSRRSQALIHPRPMGSSGRTDFSGHRRGRFPARLMRRPLTPVSPAPEAGAKVCAGASGVYGTRMLVQKCGPQDRTGLLGMPSLRLALLRRHRRPEGTGRSTRPRCVGHPRQLSARPERRGTVRRHHENLKSADERNMRAAIGDGGPAAGDLSVGSPNFETQIIAVAFP